MCQKIFSLLPLAQLTRLLKLIFPCRWFLLGEKELNKRKLSITAPFATPAMAGGLFSIDKNYFYEIGSYDAKMKVSLNVYFEGRSSVNVFISLLDLGW